MRPLLSLPLLALGLAGCGAVPGSSTYSCGLPEGVTCTSARNVYKLTNSGLPVTAMPGQPTALDPAAGGNPAPAATGPTAGPAVTTGNLASTLSPRPPLPTTGQVQTIALRPEDAGAADIVPLRTPSRVLRVWIAPWEDTAGRLHVPGYTYAEIEPRRWSIGEGAATGGLQLKPLTQPAPPTPPVSPPMPERIPCTTVTDSAVLRCPLRRAAQWPAAMCSAWALSASGASSSAPSGASGK